MCNIAHFHRVRKCDILSSDLVFIRYSLLRVSVLVTCVARDGQLDGWLSEVRAFALFAGSRERASEYQWYPITVDASRLLGLLSNTMRALERWLSGRKHRFRKPAGSKGPRGFESLPLRNYKIPRTSGDILFAGGGMCLRTFREGFERRSTVSSVDETARRCPDKTF